MFNRNVFINCPFDEDYHALLRPLLFTVMYLGFTPRIAMESLDSGRPRIDKLVKLIQKSKFAIHDLSRCQAAKRGEYFRLNMPFELGIDVGCRLFKKGPCSRKSCLILEAKKYRYQAALSDVAGSDIVVHKGKPRLVVLAVRNWLNTNQKKHAVGPARILSSFQDFMSYNYRELRARGFSKSEIENCSIPDLTKNMKKWIARSQE